MKPCMISGRGYRAMLINVRQKKERTIVSGVILLVGGLLVAGSFWLAISFSWGEGGSFGWRHIVGCIVYITCILAAIALMRRHRSGPGQTHAAGPRPNPTKNSRTRSR